MQENTEALSIAYLKYNIPKNLQELIKVEKELQKVYPPYYNLLTAQDLWQAHYHSLSTIFLKEFIELNVNRDIMIKDVKIVELNISIATVFLNMQTGKMI